MGSFKSIEKKKNKCVEKCQIVIITLHTVATMFQKTHFICHAKPEYTKFAYKNYISKIAYSKLTSFNSIQAPKLEETRNSKPSVHERKAT